MFSLAIAMAREYNNKHRQEETKKAKTKMSVLSQRLNEVSKNNEVKMYSVAGATFQEWAINRIDYKGSAAHTMIGSLVTAINNNQISVNEAESRFIAALSN